MKQVSKILSVLLISAMSFSSSFAFSETVSCSTDSSFAANSCDQCFTGGSASVGDNKGLLSDVWENISDGSQILYKEEQAMPEMISLGGASWSEVKASDSIDFWQYTPELDALYDEENLGYKLDSKAEVKWIESSLGSAYQLVSNPVSTGENIGILAYDLKTHALSENGTIDTDTDTHRECVLYTSGEWEPEVPVVPETPRLPETGAEHILLLVVALFLGFGFLKLRK